MGCGMTIIFLQIRKKTEKFEKYAVHKCLGVAISAFWSKFVLFWYSWLYSFFEKSVQLFPHHILSHVLAILILSARLSSFTYQTIPQDTFFSLFHIPDIQFVKIFWCFEKVIFSFNAGFLDFLRKLWKFKILSAFKLQPKQTAGKDFVYPLSKRQKPETQNEELFKNNSLVLLYQSTCMSKVLSVPQRINLIFVLTDITSPPFLSVQYLPFLQFIHIWMQIWDNCWTIVPNKVLSVSFCISTIWCWVWYIFLYALNSQLLMFPCMSLYIENLCW